MLWQCLSLRHLADYEGIWMQRHHVPAELDESCVFDLSQNPKKRFCAASNALPCFRLSTRLWHPASRRWFLLLEMAVSLRCPVIRSCADAAHVPLDPCAEMYTQSMLGNAMHIPSVGLVVLATLACAVPS